MAVVNMRQNAAGGPGWQLPSRGLQQHLLGVCEGQHLHAAQIRPYPIWRRPGRRWQELVESKAPLNE